VHPVINNANDALRTDGIFVPIVKSLKNMNLAQLQAGAVLISPPSANLDFSGLDSYQISFAHCSGWAATGFSAMKPSNTVGFVLSDHADWNGILTAIDRNQAERVIATHGFTDTLVSYVTHELGLQASIL
jgi:putative mRNA 3-end processing factor